MKNKLAVSFIVLTIFLIGASLTMRHFLTPEYQTSFIPWMALGGLVGLMLAGLLQAFFKVLMPIRFFLAISALMMLTGLGSSLIALAFDFKNEIKDSQSWKKTTAKITDISIERTPPGRTRNPTPYFSLWKYELTINGKTFRSNSRSAKHAATVRFFKTYNDAKLFSESIPLGQEIEIFYNPKNPEVSAIHLKEFDPVYFFVFNGLGLFCLSIVSFGIFKVIKASDIQKKI